LATTGSGKIATGDMNGEIRMFANCEKRAKTLLPGLGDPVVSIDVTEDSRWILATTAGYLLLIPTALEDGRTGFDVSMGQKKPVPIKLQLDPRDLVKYNIAKVQFTAAHFNTGEKVTEQWIVTSTGPFVITWNFKSVKAGLVRDYKIKKYDSVVVADDFRFGADNEVVVTLPDDVFCEKRFVTKRKK